MTTARRTTARVAYTPDQMFDLVADVERYPEFIPWCVALRIVSRRTEDRLEFLSADMVVAYRMFRERFRSLVRLDRDHHRIDAEYVDGPFRTLKTVWRFEADPAGAGTVIHFEIDFEFRNILLQATAQAVFEKAFARMSDAFVTRADAVYGRMPAPSAAP